MSTWFGRVLGAGRKHADVSAVDHVIPGLAPVLDGYTIAVLADLHQPPKADVEWLRHAVDATNDAVPDLIALLGDYGYSFQNNPKSSRRWYESALGTMTEELRRLRARDGVVAILGNHDYYVDPTIVRDWLRDVGAEVLVNQVRCVSRLGERLRVLGLDDLDGGTIVLPTEFDLTDQTPLVVLCHNPDSVFALDEHARADVMVAGHTHGGQIVLPWYGAPLTMVRVCERRSASGWVPNARLPLYVTRGLGEQLPIPLRINCPPEVLLLRLRSGQHPE